MLKTFLIFYSLCGVVIGYLLGLYCRHLVKKYLTEELDKSFIKHPAFPWIFAAVNGVFWVLCRIVYQDNLFEMAVCSLALSVMLCIFFVDLYHCIIFDRFQVAFLILGIAITFINYKYDLGWGFESNIIGAVCGLVSFLAVFFIGSLVMKRDVMGFGDVKLATCAGLFLGWQEFIFAMFFATVVGSIVLITIRKVRGDERFKEYPFAPFIVAGIVVSMFFGTPVINAYLSLLGL